MRLMIVEDNRTNLLVLKGIVQKLPDCEVEAFLDPVQAYARAEAELFDLILVDYMMPELDGKTFILRLRQRDEYRSIPIVMITADGNRQTRIESIAAGATDFLNKPVDPVELKARIGNLLVMRKQQRHLEDRAELLADEVARATRELAQSQEEMIWRLSRALEYRDSETGDHTLRVAKVARLLAEELGLGRKAADIIYLAAPLHDIGKVAIPDAILGKPGRLTTDEMSTMREHVQIGEQILADGATDLLRKARCIAASHHERWDGTGYPRGLAGPRIPIEGRIAGVADVFDALCSARPYKPAWPLDDAHSEITRGAGTQFDPAVVAAFERCWPEIEAIYLEDQSRQPAQLSKSA